MKKVLILFFVMGIGNIIADPTQLPDVSAPENQQSTILEIVSYNSETDNEAGEILKATAVEDNLNVADLTDNNAEGTKNAFENLKPIDGENLSLEINIDAVEDSKLGVGGNSDWNDDFNVEDNFVPMSESDFQYKDLMINDPNEIMETAAGFVPIPILKRRQKPRKQFANRRLFRRPYPYFKRFYFYPYYRYPYPSSLRFY